MKHQAWPKYGLLMYGARQLVQEAHRESCDGPLARRLEEEPLQLMGLLVGIRDDEGRTSAPGGGDIVPGARMGKMKKTGYIPGRIVAGQKVGEEQASGPGLGGQ